MQLGFLYSLFLECTCVTTDTRNCPEESMFIALRGANFNGNAFAKQALEKGCRYAIIDDPQYLEPNNPKIKLVEDCLKALQDLARFHRHMLLTPVLAITGTNGKTTTKELIAAVLKKKYNILYTEGNLNNHIGVPLTLLRLRPEHNFAIIEMGASHPGDIKELVEIAMPECGVITNIGTAHIEGFGSLEGVRRTKCELYDFLRATNGLAFVNAEDDFLIEKSEGILRVRYGTTPGLFVSGTAEPTSLLLKVHWRSGDIESDVQTNLVGSYNLNNVLAAIAFGLGFKVPAGDINKALSEYIPTNSRSQLKRTGSNILIVDAYNANPTSMMAALENFTNFPCDNKMIILGDMRELGTVSQDEHHKILEYINAHNYERVILVGEEFTKAAQDSDYETYPNAETLRHVLSEDKPQGFTILIKASNSIRLAPIADIL